MYHQTHCTEPGKCCHHLTNDGTMCIAIATEIHLRFLSRLEGLGCFWWCNVHVDMNGVYPSYSVIWETFVGENFCKIGGNSLTPTITLTKIRISQEKTSADCSLVLPIARWCCQLLAGAANCSLVLPIVPPKCVLPLNFVEKTFVTSHKTSKFKFPAIWYLVHSYSAAVTFYICQLCHTF